MCIFGKAKDKVHRDRLPALCRYGQRAEWRVGNRERFRALADFTSPNVLTDGLVLVQPVEVSTDGSVSLLAPTVSTRGGVVVFKQDLQSQIVVVGHDDAVNVVGQGSVQPEPVVRRTRRRSACRCARGGDGQDVINGLRGIAEIDGMSEHSVHAQ